MNDASLLFIGAIRAGSGWRRWLRPRRAVVEIQLDGAIPAPGASAAVAGHLACTLDGMILTVAGGTFHVDRGRGSIAFRDATVPGWSFAGRLAADLGSIAGDLDAPMSPAVRLRGEIVLRRESIESVESVGDGQGR